MKYKKKKKLIILIQKKPKRTKNIKEVKSEENIIEKAKPKRT